MEKPFDGLVGPNWNLEMSGTCSPDMIFIQVGTHLMPVIKSDITSWCWRRLVAVSPYIMPHGATARVLQYWHQHTIDIHTIQRIMPSPYWKLWLLAKNAWKWHRWAKIIAKTGVTSTIAMDTKIEQLRCCWNTFRYLSVLVGAFNKEKVLGSFSK